MAYARINHTGVHKGRVQVVNSFYLEPTDPNYDKCQAYVPVFPPEGYLGKVDKEGNPRSQADYDAWVAGLPHVWQNNPFHNHVLYFDKDTPDETIKAKIEEALNYFYNFHQKMWADNTVFIDEWKKVPKKKGTVRDEFVKGSLDPKNITDCELKATDIKTRELTILPILKSIPIVPLNIGDKGTIDIGIIAEDRASSWNAVTYTTVLCGNPANATGTIDTGEVWLAAKYGVIDFWFGTFSAAGNTLTCRDSEGVGDTAIGSKQTYSAIDIDVTIGDYWGCKAKSGVQCTVEATTSGDGVWYVTGEYIDPADSADYTLFANEEISLYGTGTSGWATIGKVNGVASASFAKMNGVAVAAIGKVNGTAV